MHVYECVWVHIYIYIYICVCVCNDITIDYDDIITNHCFDPLLQCRGFGGRSA